MSTTNRFYQNDNPKTYIVNGKNWLEYVSILSGYENFTFKGRKVFRFELFWTGVNPFDVVACRNGYSSNLVVHKRREKK